MGDRLKLNPYEGGRELEPLSYSTGKDQGELVEEILESFESADVVFLKGVVGSGKSVVGIRTALEFGGGIISVPTKVLSRQYQDDYGTDKYFLKDNGEKAKIGVLRGRGILRAHTSRIVILIGLPGSSHARIVH